jgi:hypothetical protein
MIHQIAALPDWLFQSLRLGLLSMKQAEQGTQANSASAIVKQAYKKRRAGGGKRSNSCAHPAPAIVHTPAKASAASAWPREIEGRSCSAKRFNSHQ